VGQRATMERTGKPRHRREARRVREQRGPNHKLRREREREGRRNSVRIISKLIARLPVVSFIDSLDAFAWSPGKLDIRRLYNPCGAVAPLDLMDKTTDGRKSKLVIAPVSVATAGIVKRERVSEHPRIMELDEAVMIRPEKPDPNGSNARLVPLAR